MLTQRLSTRQWVLIYRLQEENISVKSAGLAQPTHGLLDYLSALQSDLLPCPELEAPTRADFFLAS